MADGWNGGRRPGRGGADEPEPTRALPRQGPGPEQARAWSAVPPGARRGDAGWARQQPRPGQQPPAPSQRPHPRPPQNRNPRQDRPRDWAPTQPPRPVQRAEGSGRAAPARSGPPPTAPRRRRRFGWGRRLGVLALVVVVLVGGFTLYLDSRLARVPALAEYDGRPAQTAGTNWLLVGSDSRANLSAEQQAALATGDAGGNRTDTIMLLHRSSSGPSTLVSLPRDSYVPIPGNGRNKINAAFSLGGPQLLVQTVEQATGLRIDHYAEVGFGGFAGVVDAVGGVNLCLDQALDDPAAGINLAAGCQDLDGAQALGFVRSRHLYANQDLGRIQAQRKFLAALLGKATSPSTIVNPLRLVPLATNGVGSLTVDEGTHVWNVVGLGRAISSGDLVNTTVPIAGTPTLDVGSVVQWDKTRASAFFGDLAADQPIPADLLTTS